MTPQDKYTEQSYLINIHMMIGYLLYGKDNLRYSVDKQFYPATKQDQLSIRSFYLNACTFYRKEHPVYRNTETFYGSERMVYSRTDTFSLFKCNFPGNTYPFYRIDRRIYRNAYTFYLNEHTIYRIKRLLSRSISQLSRNNRTYFRSIYQISRNYSV